MPTQPTDALTAIAVDWMVRLTSGSETHTDHRAFADWLASNPAHQKAWDEVAKLLQQPIDHLRASEQQTPGSLSLARRALTGATPSLRRRQLLKGGLGLLLVGTVSGAAISRRYPLTGLTADLRTATGERTSVRLADGSRLYLNARSVVDIDYSAGERRLLLREGELVVDVATDASRPLMVQTRHGSVRALGTRFLVKQDEITESSFALVLEHSVEVTSSAHQSLTLNTGDSASFDREGIHRLNANQNFRAAWLDGLLDVRNQSLQEVVAALRAYRAGVIRLSPQAAALRVFGVFRLDDTDATLRMLADTLPIRLRRFGPWLTLIDIH